MLNKKQKVLVTGGAGFIGSHQVDSLVEKGYQVVVVDNLATGKKENINPEVKFYQLSILDDSLESVFKDEKPEYVFHFAAQISVNDSVKDPSYDAQVNIVGALKLLALCVKYKVKKVMFSSTGGALYGEAEQVPTSEDYFIQPISPYGIAKSTVEKYIHFYFQQYGLEYGIMRYANVYGPRQDSQGEAGVIAIFINKFLDREQPFIFGDGHQTRDYVYVSDVVRANMKVFESDVVDVYNVATSRQTTVNEIFDLINLKLDTHFEKKYAPGFPGQKVSCLSYDKIESDFNWEPEVDLEEGIERTVEWFVEQR